MFRSEHMTFAWWEFRAGHAVHEHHHPNEEVWHVIEGRLEVTIGDETQVAGPGCAAIVPPDTPHSVRVLEDCRAIVVDHPIRDQVGGAKTE